MSKDPRLLQLKDMRTGVWVEIEADYGVFATISREDFAMRYLVPAVAVLKHHAEEREEQMHDESI